MEIQAGGVLRLWAPAKINLNLLVGPRRDDGFHPLDSCVAKITLYDRIDLICRQDGHLHLKTAGADCGDPEENLVLRAARLLRERKGTGSAAVCGACPLSSPQEKGTDSDFKRRNRSQSPFPNPGADLELHKNIPPGAGLGGGSSDAAAVLVGLSEMWHLNAHAGELAALAAKLGSDVPLFLGPPSSRMTGRGEILQPAAVCPFVAGIFLNDCFCSTAEVYRAFDQSPPETCEQLDPSALASEPPSRWRHRLVNQLFPAALKVCPALGELWNALRAALPCPVHMSGSGSALFILCDDERELAAMLARVPKHLQGRFIAVRNSPF
jgi:4-diphosphocytidyl-2-C-methyl-D-erythritol kinase